MNRRFGAESANDANSTDEATWETQAVINASQRSTGVNQSGTNVDASLLAARARHRNVERGIVVLVGRIHRGARLEEEASNVFFSIHSRGVEGGAPLVITLSEISMALDNEDLNNA